MSGNCSLRRPRRRIYTQNAAEDGGLSLGNHWVNGEESA